MGWNPDTEDHAYTDPTPEHDAQDEDELALFQQSMTENVQVADESAVCYGVQGLCNLKYNQVVWAAAHNAGAYKLTMDIAKLAKCAQQEQSCTAGFDSVCDSWASRCSSWGGWSWVCRGFVKVCTHTKKVCRGWGTVCKKTIQVAEFLVPDWVESCVWENQDRTLGGLMRNGVRYHDIDICPKNGVLYMCHGKGATPRALGYRLIDGLREINSFLASNPNEIVTIKFGDYDGQASEVGPLLKKDIRAAFGSKLYAGSYSNWPTLAQMKRTPVVIAMSGSLRNHGPAYNWAKWGGPWHSWSFAINNVKTTEDIDRKTKEFCKVKGQNGHPKTIDFFGTLRLPTKDEIKKGRVFWSKTYRFCNKAWAKKLSNHMDEVMDSCDADVKLGQLHSVMTDYDEVSGVFPVVKMLNQRHMKNA